MMYKFKIFEGTPDKINASIHPFSDGGGIIDKDIARGDIS